MHMSLNLPPGMAPGMNMGPSDADVQQMVKMQQKQHDEGRRATAMHLAIQRREGAGASSDRLTVEAQVDEARVIAKFLRDG